MMSNPAVQQSVAQMMSGGGSPEGLAGMMGAMGGMPGMPTPAAASSGAAPAAVDGGEGGGSLMDKLSRLGVPMLLCCVVLWLAVGVAGCEECRSLTLTRWLGDTHSAGAGSGR